MQTRDKIGRIVCEDGCDREVYNLDIPSSNFPDRHLIYRQILHSLVSLNDVKITVGDCHDRMRDVEVEVRASKRPLLFSLEFLNKCLKKAFPLSWQCHSRQKELEARLQYKKKAGVSREEIEEARVALEKAGPASIPETMADTIRKIIHELDAMSDQALIIDSSSGNIDPSRLRVALLCIDSYFASDACA